MKLPRWFRRGKVSIDPPNLKPGSHTPDVFGGQIVHRQIPGAPPTGTMPPNGDGEHDNYALPGPMNRFKPMPPISSNQPPNVLGEPPGKPNIFHPVAGGVGPVPIEPKPIQVTYQGSNMPGETSNQLVPPISQEEHNYMGPPNLKPGQPNAHPPQTGSFPPGGGPDGPWPANSNGQSASPANNGAGKFTGPNGLPVHDNDPDEHALPTAVSRLHPMQHVPVPDEHITLSPNLKPTPNQPTLIGTQAANFNKPGGQPFQPPPQYTTGSSLAAVEGWVRTQLMAAANGTAAPDIGMTGIDMDKFKSYLDQARAGQLVLDGKTIQMIASSVYTGTGSTTENKNDLALGPSGGMLSGGGMVDPFDKNHNHNEHNPFGGLGGDPRGPNRM